MVNDLPDGMEENAHRIAYSISSLGGSANVIDLREHTWLSADLVRHHTRWLNGAGYIETNGSEDVPGEEDPVRVWELTDEGEMHIASSLPPHMRQEERIAALESRISE